MVKEGGAWFDQIQKTAVAVSAVQALAVIQAEDGIRDLTVTGVQTCALPISNTGTQTWVAGGSTPVHLGVHFGTTDDGWGAGWSTDQRFALPADLAAGASVTLSVDVTAPSAAGNYVLRHRMVKEGVAWFDQIQKTTVTVSAVQAL